MSEPCAVTAKLEVRALGKRFGPAGGSGGSSTEVLADVSFSAAAGEFVAIVGASGCGKSTLLRIVAGLESPSVGEVLVDQRPVFGPDRDRAMVFQDYSLYPWLNVWENIKFGARLKANRARRRRGAGAGAAVCARGAAPAVDASVAHVPVDAAVGDVPAEAGTSERASLLLELMGLAHVRDAHPNALSGGMRQRVAIARALLNQPEVLLMDEPFGALDAQTREVMHELILHIVALEKRTIVFVTHDVQEAVYLADRVIVLAPRPGRIDSVWTTGLPAALERRLPLKRTAGFLSLEGQILDRIRATSGLRSDAEALRRLTGARDFG
jgi:NitT/TauT family transport system ATP-binding protein